MEGFYNLGATGVNTRGLYLSQDFFPPFPQAEERAATV